MHANRYKYNLQEYQQVLEKRNKSFALLLKNKKTNKQMLYFPKTRSMWATQFAKNYTNKRFHLMYNTIKLNHTRMITLTYSTKLYTPEQVARRHKKDIKEFIRRMRLINKNFQYTYFVEVTKRLYVHFHLYTNQFILHQDIKEIWQQVTGSYIVYVNLIKSEQQKMYTANYNSILQKFSQYQLEFAWKHISRFWSSSRHFFPKGEPQESLFEFVAKMKLKGQELQNIVETCKAGNVAFIDYADFEDLFNKRQISVTFKDETQFIILSLDDHL